MREIVSAVESARRGVRMFRYSAPAGLDPKFSVTGRVLSYIRAQRAVIVWRSSGQWVSMSLIQTQRRVHPSFAAACLVARRHVGARPADKTTSAEVAQALRDQEALWAAERRREAKGKWWARATE